MLEMAVAVVRKMLDVVGGIGAKPFKGDRHHGAGLRTDFKSLGLKHGLSPQPSHQAYLVVANGVQRKMAVEGEIYGVRQRDLGIEGKHVFNH